MIKAPRGVRPGGRRPGRQGDLLPGALLRPVLLPGAGRGVLRVRRVGARADHRALRGARRRARHGHGAAGVRARAARRPLQHGRGDRRRRHATSASTASTTCRRCTGFWEKFYFRPGNLGYPVFDTAVGQGRRLHLLRPALPRGLAGARPERRADRVQPVRDQPRACRSYLWKLEQPAAAVANEYYIGAINRVGIEELGDDDFYGTSYFVDPEGQLVGEVGAADDRRAGRPGPRPGPASTPCATVGVLPRPPAGRVRRPGPPVRYL